MLSLLIALLFFAVSLGFYVVTQTLKKRHRNWKAFAEKRGLAFDPESFELAGELMGLSFRVHDKLGIERVAKLGAYMPVGSTAVAVDVPVPGCPAGLALRSKPAKLAPRKVGSALEVASAPGSFESAFAVEPGAPEDLGVLENEEVRQALQALVSNRWFRGVVLEEGTLCAFHFNPAFGSAQDAEELERTVGMALDAAAALREACAARPSRKRTPKPARRRGPSSADRAS